MAWRLLRRWIDRLVRFRYGPSVTLLVVAAGSLAVLRWSHVTWRSSLSQTVAALDNVQQARLRLTQAYLVTAQVAAGDPTARLDQAVADLQAATAALDDWLAGRSTLLGFRGAPLTDPELRRHVGE